MAHGMVQNDVILQLENHKDVFTSPIKQSERIKYTCFAVSKNFLIFGAISGGLYAFKRNPYSFWQLIPSKESAITFVSISPSENFIAFATNKNIICILELNELANCKLVIRTDDLTDSEITALCWSDDFHKPTLYIGDVCGRVSSLKLSFLNKSILHLPTTLSMTLDSRVIQLSWQNGYLLASTLTRCFLCDTVKEQFKQIGQQLRDGYYGATFVCKDADNVRIFCARPGSRLWEVSLDAMVHSTHQFKGLLATPPTTFISLLDEPKIVETKSTDCWPPQSFNFAKLYDLLGTYIVTFKKDGLYILNVDTVDVLFWNNSFGEIVDVQCISNTIFVWNSVGDLHEFTVLSIIKCLLTLYLKELYDLCTTLICRWCDKLASQQPESLAALNPLCDLECPQLNDEEKILFNKFKNEVRVCTSNNIKLNSGIHVVNNRHFSTLLLDDNDLRITSHEPRSLLRRDSDEFRKRSHSLPSTLKKEESINRNTVNGPNEVRSGNHDTYKERFPNSDNLYLELGLYNSPFITLASYEILEECISDLSSSVSEKFNESSKSLKQKWRGIENKLNFLRNTKTTERPNNVMDENIVVNNKIFFADIVDAVEEDNEPVVQPRRRKSSEMNVNYDKIIELCNQEDSNDFELLNLVVCEYQNLVKKYGIAKYERFPFSLPEKSLKKMKKIFEKLLTSDSLLRWFEYEDFPINVDIDFKEVYPPLLIETFSREDLRLDFLLCKTLVIFTEIMNAPTILETIKLLNLPCYYMSFCYVMVYFQNSEILERNNYSKGNSAHWPLPVYLNTMLLMISLDQADVFCEMGMKNKVDPTDVIYMMFHLGHNEKELGHPEKYRNVCLTYLQKHYECQDFIPLTDTYLVSLALKMLMAINDELELCCSSCWFLLPEAVPSKLRFLELAKKMLSFLWNIFLSACEETDSISLELLLVIQRSLSDRTDYQSLTNVCYKNNELCKHVMCSRLAEQIASPSGFVLLSFNIVCTFCYRVPDLWKYLSSIQSSSRFKILSVEHFIQLGDIVEMESTLPNITAKEARMILMLKSKLLDGFCLNCDGKIPVIRNGTSCNDLTLFILRRLGAKSCLHVLDTFTEKLELEESFYRSILLSALPGVNSELMNPIATTVSSHCKVDPVSKKVAEELDKAMKLDLPDREFMLRKSEAHHWGVTVNVDDANQAICYCCSLPLFSKYLIKEDNGGIMLFSCSHTYHTICLKNKDCTATCLVCDRFLR